MADGTGGGTDTSTGPGRGQRADAKANRGRILDAAEEIFGAGGETASTEQVARLAGVGIGTVFRHFPTKAALLSAVLVRRFDRLTARAEALLDHADPGRAFFDFFQHMVWDAAGKIAIGEALLAAGGGDESEGVEAANALRRSVGALLHRAQEAGAVRDDVELPEVYALLVGASRAAAQVHFDGEVTERVLAIVFDGLRARPRS